MFSLVVEVLSVSIHHDGPNCEKDGFKEFSNIDKYTINARAHLGMNNILPPPAYVYDFYEQNYAFEAYMNNEEKASFASDMSCFFYETQSDSYSYAGIYLIDDQWCQIGMYLVSEEFSNLVDLVKFGFKYFTFTLATNVEQQMSHPNSELTRLSSVKNVDANISSILHT